MASVVFDRRRGMYSIQWKNGVRFVRTPAFQISGWKKGGPRPKRNPAEVTAALTECQKKERLAKSRGATRPVDEKVAGFLAAYQVGYALARAEGSAGELANAVTLFLRWCDEVEVSRMEEITPSACQKFLVYRAGMPSQTKGRTIAYETIKKEKALLAAAWQRAVDLGEIEKNPWHKLEIPAKRETRHKGSWSPEQYEKLLQACRPWLRDIVVVGCHCGLRISALLGITWDDISPSGEIVVPKHLDKAGKGYRLPIHPTVHEVLMRRRAMGDATDRVLTGQNEMSSRGDTTAEAITSACRRAGLPKPSSPNHHMRRTFGRWAVLGQLTGQPVPLYVVSQWMGHSTVEMTEKYLDLPRDVSAQWMTNETGDHS